MERFVAAQKQTYPQALKEIRSGRKCGHWIWYIFPQLASLGYSYNAKYYGISGLDEARAYLAHEGLRANLLEISQALLDIECSDPCIVMDGYTDAMKLRSSMTLFAQADPECEVFGKVLDKFFGGRIDFHTAWELFEP